MSLKGVESSGLILTERNALEGEGRALTHFLLLLPKLEITVPMEGFPDMRVPTEDYPVVLLALTHRAPSARGRIQVAPETRLRLDRVLSRGYFIRS